MKHGSRGNPFRIGAGLAILLVAAACTEAGPTSSVDEALLSGALDHLAGNTQRGTPAIPNVELVEVCKRWVGTAATANFTVDDGSVSLPYTDGGFPGPFSALGHNDWFCADVYISGALETVTVTETSVSGGTNPYTTVVQAAGNNTAPVIAGTSVTGEVAGGRGFTAYFTNTEVVPPGDQGCTPGYWKQEHHFDSWAGYAPGDSYDAIFGVSSSFGGSLLDALKRGGGKEKALGRHATAALLNASSGGVASVYTVAEVIAMVQDAYASGDFNGVKNLLAAANELGCPLN